MKVGASSNEVPFYFREKIICAKKKRKISCWKTKRRRKFIKVTVERRQLFLVPFAGRGVFATNSAIIEMPSRSQSVRLMDHNDPHRVISSEHRQHFPRGKICFLEKNIYEKFHNRKRFSSSPPTRMWFQHEKLFSYLNLKKNILFFRFHPNSRHPHIADISDPNTQPSVDQMEFCLVHSD